MFDGVGTAEAWLEDGEGGRGESRTNMSKKWQHASSESHRRCFLHPLLLFLSLYPPADDDDDDEAFDGAHSCWVRVSRDGSVSR